MKRISWVVALGLALILTSGSAPAITPGALPAAASTIRLLNGVTGPTTSASWLNSDYSSNTVSWTLAAGSITGFELQLQASDDNTNWFTIADTTSTSPTYMSVGGYYPYIRVSLVTFTTPGGSNATIYYSGAPVGGAIVGAVTIQGLPLGTPIPINDPANHPIATGTPVCTFSYTTNACDIGASTATGTGCTITNSSSCNFPSTSQYYRITCSSALQFQFNTGVTTITFGATSGANATGVQGPFVLQHFDTLSASSGNCDIEVLQ